MDKPQFKALVMKKQVVNERRNLTSSSKIEAALEDRSDVVVADDYMDIDRYREYVAEIKLCRAGKVVREKLVLFL